MYKNSDLYPSSLRARNIYQSVYLTNVYGRSILLQWASSFHGITIINFSSF